MRVGKPPLWLTVPAILLFALTAFLPLLAMLALFLYETLREPRLVWGILAAPRQWTLLGRSLGIGLLVTGFSLVVGVPLGWVLSARDLPCRRVFRWMMLVPLVIPPYVLTGAWLHVFAPFGWLNRSLAQIGGAGAMIRFSSWPACVWSLAQCYTPVVVLFTIAGCRSLDCTVVDAARLETGGWRLWRSAVFPQLKPHLLAGSCFVMVFTLVQYSVPSLLGVQTYPVEIFTQFSAFYDQTAAVAASLPLVVLVLVLILVQARIMSDRPYPLLAPGSEAEAGWRLGSARYGLAVILALGWGLSLAWPFACVFAQAAGWRSILACARGHVDWIVYTSGMALAAAGLATALGAVLAPWLAQGRSRFLHVLDLCCWFPVAWPGTVMALGILKIRTLLPIRSGPEDWGAALLCAYTGLFSAWAIRICLAGYRRLDPHVAELADLDCPHWPVRWWHVDRVLLGPSFGLAAILVFVLVVGELNATILLLPPGKHTLAVSIDNLLHYGASATASALCLLEAGLVVLALAAGTGLINRLARPSHKKTK